MQTDRQKQIERQGEKTDRPTDAILSTAVDAIWVEHLSCVSFQPREPAGWGRLWFCVQGVLQGTGRTGFTGHVNCCASTT